MNNFKRNIYRIAEPTTFVHNFGINDYANDLNACQFGTPSGLILYSSDQILVPGSYLYTDVNLTIPWNSFMLFHLYDSMDEFNAAIRTSVTGLVETITVCP